VEAVQEEMALALMPQLLQPRTTRRLEVREAQKALQEMLFLVSVNTTAAVAVALLLEQMEWLVLAVAVWAGAVVLVIVEMEVEETILPMGMRQKATQMEELEGLRVTLAGGIQQMQRADSVEEEQEQVIAVTTVGVAVAVGTPEAVVETDLATAHISHIKAWAVVVAAPTPVEQIKVPH
jgi:hypothetical protein